MSLESEFSQIHYHLGQLERDIAEREQQADARIKRLTAHLREIATKAEVNGGAWAALYAADVLDELDEDP